MQILFITNMEDFRQLLPVGTVLQDRYRVDEQLASGGFGNTYVVTNIRFDERWAMKEFFMKGISERDGDTCSVSVASASKPQFEAQREKFNKEARRLRRLRHPGIVHVEDLFDENGTSYYVMDYIGGGSLAEAIKRHGPLSEQRVRQILPYMLDALEYVHNQKMWHLDLKPGNILLKNDGQPVLIDFGASKQLGLSGANSTSTAMTYTQGYAPSEQVDQNLDRIGPWTDLYALGATLYILLSGKTPPMVSEIQEAESEAFIFPKGISEQMRKLILWMMNSNRRKRPQSVAEVRAFLTIEATESLPPDSVDDEGTRMPDNSSKKKEENSNEISPWHKYRKAIISGVAVATMLILAIILWPKDSEEMQTIDVTEDVPLPKTVTNLNVSSSIGDYSYTGPVNSEGKPDGTGEARFSDGRSYTGPFVNGIMQGKGAHFNMANGDSFEGEFQDNRFYEGQYTVRDDGSYFKGTFKGGQPDKGQWYDKNGKRL